MAASRVGNARTRSVRPPLRRFGTRRTIVAVAQPHISIRYRTIVAPSTIVPRRWCCISARSTKRDSRVLPDTNHLPRTLAVFLKTIGGQVLCPRIHSHSFILARPNPASSSRAPSPLHSPTPLFVSQPRASSAIYFTLLHFHFKILDSLL